MIAWTNWFSPLTLRLLALALLHFLWQGTALGALAYVLMGLCRSAATRYAIGVGTLALMLAAPIGTFVFLRTQNQQASAPVQSLSKVGNFAISTVAPASARASNTPPPTRESAPYLLWFVEAWFAGVLLLSLRSAAGFLLVERLRRKESISVTGALLEECMALQRSMHLNRAIRYCQSLQLRAPAVAGWIRPVVLLPFSAITGLSEEQLRAVIAHELAHIQRHDAFVNVFQVAVETLLFYHPAVWWLGKRIRAERENCCDDIAVALSGSAFTYADALTRMAGCKAAPQLVMAANRSPVVERIARILGAQPVESLRSANLSGGVLCLVAALLAGSAFVGNVGHVQAQTPAPAPVQRTAEPSVRAGSAAHLPPVPDTAFVVRPSDAAPDSIPKPESVHEPSQSREPQVTPSSSKQSYIDSLKEAGLTNLSVDELIGLKVQGVTAEYVRAMKDLGVKMEPDELIGMKVQGINPEYVKEMRTATGEPLDSEALIGLKVQGVTPEYIREMRELGLKTDSEEIIGMKVQGVTPEYVREMRGLGLKLDGEDIIGMKVQGITPAYVKNVQSLGFHPEAEELIAMKVQGVSADYIKELQGAGFKVDIEEAIGAKVQGVTPEFIAKARSHGFKDLTLEKLIELKSIGVLDSEK